MRLIAPLLLLLIVGCANSPQSPNFSTPPEVTPDGLERFASPVFELVYIRPGLDLSAYKLIQVRPIGVGYKRDPSKGPMLLRPAGNFELTQAQRNQVSRALAKAFTEAMTSNQRYRIVTEPVDGAMLVQLALARIEVNIPEAGKASDEILTVEKAGEMTLVVEISDAISGEPMVRGRDTYVFAGSGHSRTDINLEISEVFARWARQIREGLDQLSPGRS